VRDRLKEEMMMYNNKLAIAVKSNGKVLREFGETVYVPFGTEYTLLIKNLHSVRVQVRVTIDGQNATQGCSLVIQPNSEMELERFIKEGNMNKGNRFKFIERTAGIEAHRGIGVTDGLIRIEYEFEKPYVAPTITTTWPVYPLTHPWREEWVKEERWTKKERPWLPQPIWYNTGTADLSGGVGIHGAVQSSSAVESGLTGVLRGKNTTVGANASQEIGSLINKASYSAQHVLSSTHDSYTPKAVENEAGITVAGGVSEQKFHAVGWFPVETTTHVMVIKLLGETEAGKPIVVPVTVKSKPKCVTCGHNNKAKAKFCIECGTSLEIV
jgi:hypothetical protein